MLHDLIEERYLKGPKDLSSYFFDNFDWVVIDGGDLDENLANEQPDEMIQWCLENCISKFSWGYKFPDHRPNYTEYGFIFQNIYDAMAFKLMWT